MRPGNWKWAWLAVLAAACGLTSCATRDSGYKISEETIAFIRPGETTRAEVIENLGPPLLELRDIRASAYTWGKMRLAVSGKQVMREDPLQSRQMTGYSLAPPPSEEGTLVEHRRWLCCLAFDDQGKVRRVERIRVEGSPSLEKALRDWAAGEQ
jgi:hypothetical protein